MTPNPIHRQGERGTALALIIALMLPLGLVEVSRTGIVAIARGPEGM